MSDAEGPRLSKEQRKDLLAQLEASTSRTEPPERLLLRAQEALQQSNQAQARRLLQQLEAEAPQFPGLAGLRRLVMTSEQNAKLQANLKRAEDMLTQSIQQRKKQLAQMALETLTELAPHHPRLAEWQIWVRDLDQEVELQKRVDELLGAGRAAIQSGDTAAARRQLEALRNFDPWNRATEDLANEIDAAERGAVASADIGKLKQTIEAAIEKRNVGAAQQGLEQLGSMDVPKITVDFYAKRIGDLRQKLTDEAEARELERRFTELLTVRNWQEAREVAREYGRRFPSAPRGTQLFNQVSELEATERRQASIQQGLQQVEQAIAQRDKALAEMGLRVLRGMSLEPQKLAELEAKIRAL